MAGTNVAITFSPEAFREADRFRRERGHETLGQTVGESLKINLALLRQKAQGFTQIILRDPDTGNERIMLVWPFDTLVILG